jgi:cell wall-associated NlpC family hydrolase
MKRGDLIFYNTTGGTVADHVAIFQGVTPDGAYMVEAQSIRTGVRTTPVRRSDVIEYGTYR